jgi:hypothetical protein
MYTNKLIIILIFLLTPAIAWPAAQPHTKAMTKRATKHPMIAFEKSTMIPNFDKPLKTIMDNQCYPQLKNENVGWQIVTNLKYLKQQTFDAEPQSTERPDLPNEILEHISKYASKARLKFCDKYYEYCDLETLASLRLSCRTLRAQSHTAWHETIIKYWGAKIISEEIQYGHAKNIKELLDLGANTVGTKTGKPLLVKACELFRIERWTPIDKHLKFNLMCIITDLLNAGANPNEPHKHFKDKFEPYIEINAIMEAPYEICTLLLSLSQHTIDIDAQSDTGPTALIKAVLQHDRPKVQLLLLHNADQNKTYGPGWPHTQKTAIQWAQDRNYSEIEEDLRDMSTATNRN